jgi:hypothetical protein
MSNTLLWIILSIIIIIIIFILIIVAVVLSSRSKKDLNVDVDQIKPNFDEKKSNDSMVCKVQRDCPSGYICSKGKCKKGLGEPCNSDNDCHSSYVCDGVCRKRTYNEKKKIIRTIKVDRGNIQNESLGSESVDSDQQNRYYEMVKQKGHHSSHSSPHSSSHSSPHSSSHSSPHSSSDSSSDSSSTDSEKTQKTEKEYPVDVCCYSIYVIYLMNNGNIILEEDGNTRKITSNVHIRNVCNFSGYINGISTDGNLYYLDNNTLDSDNWKWRRLNVVYIQDNIIDFSVTHDYQNLWIRTNDYGILYDTDYQVVEKISDPQRRIYGVDKTNYLVIDKKGITSYPNVKHHGKSEGIIDILIDHRGVIHSLTKNKYRMIKLINYEVCYIA